MNKAFGVAAVTGLMAMGAVQANAQSIRLFTLRGSECYEVIEGSRTAGGYVRQNRGTLCGVPIVGYTDRVQRTEWILTHISGSGFANAAGIKINGRVAISVPSYPLPSLDLRRVSSNPNADNVVVFVIQGRNTVEKRVPIGTR